MILLILYDAYGANNAYDIYDAYDAQAAQAGVAAGDGEGDNVSNDGEAGQCPLWIQVEMGFS